MSDIVTSENVHELLKSATYAEARSKLSLGTAALSDSTAFAPASNNTTKADVTYVDAELATKSDTIASIAALKAFTDAVDNRPVEVLGYYSEGDGGGGTFFWDAASTETDNGGTIIAATGVTTGRWKRVYSGAVDVKWFGAKGDGSTNDTLAIQSALDAHSEVYFSVGSYYTDAQLDINSNQSIACAKAAKITTSDNLFHHGLSLVGVTDVFIDGLNIQGPSVGDGFDIAIYSEDVSNITIQNCTIRGVGKVSASTEKGHGLLFTSNSIIEPVIGVSGNFNITVVNNTITDIKGHGDVRGDAVYFRCVKGGSIHGNTLGNTRRMTIALTDYVYDVRITDNEIFDCHLAGIDLEPNSASGDSVVISGNTIRNFGIKPAGQTGVQYHGIDVRGMNNVNISNNVIIAENDQAHTCIYVINRADKCVISDNTLICNGYASNGMYLYAGSGLDTVTITGNIIEEFTEYGISSASNGNDNILIDGNNIHSTQSDAVKGIFVGAGQCHISDNIVKVDALEATQNYPYGIHVSQSKRATIIGNQVRIGTGTGDKTTGGILVYISGEGLAGSVFNVSDNFVERVSTESPVGRGIFLWGRTNAKGVYTAKGNQFRNVQYGLAHSEYMERVGVTEVSSVDALSKVNRHNYSVWKNNETVEVLGYYSEGDGGGGTFYWDADSTDAHNGGTVIEPLNSTGDGRWKRVYSGAVDVKWFGVKSTDSDTTTRTNNTTYINGIVTSGFTDIYIPQGSFYFNGTWTIDGVRRIQGAGDPLTQLHNNADVDFIVNTTGGNDLTIGKLYIKYDGGSWRDFSSTSKAFSVGNGGSGKHEVEDISIHEYHTGIYYADLYWLLSISRCNVWLATKGYHLASQAGGPTTTTFTKCWAKSCKDGYDIEKCSSVSLIGCAYDTDIQYEGYPQVQVGFPVQTNICGTVSIYDFEFEAYGDTRWSDSGTPAIFYFGGHGSLSENVLIDGCTIKNLEVDAANTLNLHLIRIYSSSNRNAYTFNRIQTGGCVNTDNRLKTHFIQNESGITTVIRWQDNVLSPFSGATTTHQAGTVRHIDLDHTKDQPILLATGTAEVASGDNLDTGVDSSQFSGTSIQYTPARDSADYAQVITNNRAIFNSSTSTGNIEAKVHHTNISNGSSNYGSHKFHWALYGYQKVKND